MNKPPFEKTEIQSKLKEESDMVREAQKGDTNYILQLTIGYLGYFLIGFMALRALLIQDDTEGFNALVLGLLLLVSYVQFLEKKHETPKYSGYIKLALIIVFLISGFILFY